MHPPTDPPAPDGLLLVAPDDPEYCRLAAAEAAFWQKVHPFGLEATEKMFRRGPVDRYVNERFTGDPNTHWAETIVRWGTFRRGLMLGTSAMSLEARILETNPTLHLTFMDLSGGAVERRQRLLGTRFPGRVATETADLNFAELPPKTYDLIASSTTLHHVTNLEHLAFQINRSLTPAGHFFLDDYVGEPRFAFSEEKKRLYEAVYIRDLARQRGRRPGLVWFDATDLSPFCGVRSDEILDVLRVHLDETEVRTASALTIPLVRSRPADLDQALQPARWQKWWAHLQRRLGVLRADMLSRAFLDELFLVGDAASEAGLIRPGVAFAVYRKRRDRRRT